MIPSPHFSADFGLFMTVTLCQRLEQITLSIASFFETFFSWQTNQRKLCYYHNRWKHQIPGADVRANPGNIHPAGCTGIQQKNDSEDTSKSDKVLLVPSSRCSNASSLRLGCSYGNMWITLLPLPQLLKNVRFREDCVFYVSDRVNQHNLGICRKSYSAEILGY